MLYVGVWVVNATSQLLYPWERDPVPTLWESGWSPEHWTHSESILIMMKTCSYIVVCNAVKCGYVTVLDLTAVKLKGARMGGRFLQHSVVHFS